jgi:DMSO/TMAO reductase YedYZ molybdopterin-dependent catalytic subunit
VNEIVKPRRRFLTRAAAAATALLLAGCDRLSRTEWFPRVLAVADKWNYNVAHAVTPRNAMAQEFAESDRSPQFRSNGTADPGTDEYRALSANGFADYRLAVAGMVAQPKSFSLADLRVLPSRTQITRHDCVEGWSAIAKWKGVKLSAILDIVKPAPGARYVMFFCADPMEEDGTDFYYESIDMDDAHHPQTILAYELNDAPLPVANGAPLRLRVERQLGYKHAKYVTAIAIVDTFGNVAGGKGGYWEDQGYQWYAGI